MKSIIIICLCFTSVYLNEITFSMGASTYSSGIAIGGQIPITAKAETQTTGTVTVGEGALILKEGGGKTTGSELSCNPSSKIEAVAGNIYTLGIITNDATKFTHAGDANLVFTLGTSKTLTYSTENPNPSSENPNSGSSSAFSLKFSMISLLLFFLF